MALTLFALAAAVLGIVSMAVVVPFDRWRFEHGGRTFEIANYSFREVVHVDGVALAGTRTDDEEQANTVSHAVALSNGERLDIRISVAMLKRRCVARVGDVVVFDSQGAIPQITTAAAAPVPELQEEPTDPRWQAAQVLFADLSGHDEIAPAAQALRGALREAIGRWELAREAANAHAALGGVEDLSDLVSRRDQAVQELIALLRELHLAGASRASDRPAPVPMVVEVLGRLEAEREVDELRLQQARLQRASAGKNAQ